MAGFMTIRRDKNAWDGGYLFMLKNILRARNYGLTTISR
jgi:hypothetical protein